MAVHITPFPRCLFQPAHCLSTNCAHWMDHGSGGMATITPINRFQKEVLRRSRVRSGSENSFDKAIFHPLPPVNGHQKDFSIPPNGQCQKLQPPISHRSDASTNPSRQSLGIWQHRKTSTLALSGAILLHAFEQK